MSELWPWLFTAVALLMLVLSLVFGGMSGLWLVTVARVALGLAYAAVSIYIVHQIGTRAAPAPAAATQCLPAHQVLKNTIAAVLTIPRALAKQRGISENSSVIITRGGKPFGPPGKVLRMDCDAQSCTVIVGLEKISGEIIDPAAVASADLEPAPIPSSPSAVR